MIRVVYLAHRLPYPVDKGEKIRTFHQIQHLVEQGFQVSVFAPIEHPDELLFAAALREKLNVTVVTAPLGSTIKRKLTTLIRGCSFSEMHFYSPQLLNLLMQSLQQLKPDAIVCTSSVMAAYLFKVGLASSHLKDCTLLMDFMDLDSDKWLQYARSTKPPMGWVYQREAKLISKLELQVYRAFQRCFFISENEVNLFSQRLDNADKLSVLANGIDAKAFYPAKKTFSPALTAPVFLFTGVMNYLPNEDAVLWFVESMWGSIKKQWPNATFYIAGMQPSQRIQDLAKKPGVVVTGYVDDILPYYHKADIFVGPFRLARGVQNKILQAMACGLPVVTTTLGAEGIACQPGKDLLIADDESAFVEKVNQLLQESDLRQVIGAQALQVIAERYSWQGVLRHLPHFITERVS